MEILGFEIVDSIKRDEWVLRLTGKFLGFEILGKIGSGNNEREKEEPKDFWKFLWALHQKCREKVMAIKESNDLSSLALDERISDLKVQKVIMEKDSEVYKGKNKKGKSTSLKARNESSDDETLISRSEDEEYAMAVRDFKKFFRRNVHLLIIPVVEHRHLVRTCELTSFWQAAATVGIPVEFQRISLTGFRSCASRSQIRASQSRQSMDCHKFDSWKNLTSHLPRACLMLALAGFPSSLSSSIPVGTLPLFLLFSFLIFPKDFYSNLEDCPWSSITEFVYLVDAHHYLNPIFISKDDSPRGLDDGVVMLVLKARGHPLRFGEVHLSLVALNPKLEVFYVLSYNQLSGPLVDGRSENLLVFSCTPLQSKTDLAPFALVQHQDSMPPSSSRWTVQLGACGILPFGIKDESHPDERL
nr:alpha/beta hydrolases superfamily protein [Tanacetum cinerariifolium]